MVSTESLLDGNQLSLTQLGRNIQGKVRAKHSIKRIDRLLGNPHLRGAVYLAKKSPLSCHIHLYKEKPKYRKDRRSSKAGRNHTAQKSYLTGSKEPWLLATSFSSEYYPA
ncbi:hypothetical protein Sps_01268 [Shewanella psychrophila]|uniref:Transposase n=1 Tax=Shewanella psychrophila TaxID=225848 RepID=A0A1S6HLN8_9GAMM|nr:hypothetical protein Sps_01268 [Shewanella psychrophila]